MRQNPLREFEIFFADRDTQQEVGRWTVTTHIDHRPRWLIPISFEFKFEQRSYVNSSHQSTSPLK